MNVLCSDKTGTLTEGRVEIHSAMDIDGHENQKILLYASINACFETGYTNPIDKVIRAQKGFDLSEYHKLDEVPYDFIRKRLSILAEKDSSRLMITKGALHNVLDACSFVETAEGGTVDIAAAREKINRQFREFSTGGFRTLGVAYRDVGSESTITRDHESGMTFLGFLVLYDPPKAGVAETISRLKELGVAMKVITGDNRLVAASVAKQVGLSDKRILTGPDLHRMGDEALLRQVEDVDVFAEVEPNHKELIIISLKKSGNVVGFLGDGINDAAALHAADVGISVDSAVDGSSNRWFRPLW